MESDECRTVRLEWGVTLHKCNADSCSTMPCKRNVISCDAVRCGAVHRNAMLCEENEIGRTHSTCGMPSVLAEMYSACVGNRLRSCRGDACGFVLCCAVRCCNVRRSDMPALLSLGPKPTLISLDGADWRRKKGKKKNRSSCLRLTRVYPPACGVATTSRPAYARALAREAQEHHQGLFSARHGCGARIVLSAHRRRRHPARRGLGAPSGGEGPVCSRLVLIAGVQLGCGRPSFVRKALQERALRVLQLETQLLHMPAGVSAVAGLAKFCHRESSEVAAECRTPHRA